MMRQTRRMQSDIVVPFLFDAMPVRGAIVQLDDAWRRLRSNHDYAGVVRDTLGHAAAATALLAQSLKSDSSVTLQITGGGPLSMLVMQCNTDLQLRGLATAYSGSEKLAFTDLVTEARCAITIRSKATELPYQGIVEVAGASLAESLEAYYERSAQVSSHLVLVADENFCGGLLLQQMPDRERPDADDWCRLGLLAATLRVDDLLSGIGSALLGKLFAEDDLRVFDPREASFFCPCSRERAANVLKLLGRDECDDACREQGSLVVTCEYCAAVERFDSVDVASLFRDPDVPTSSAIH